MSSNANVLQSYLVSLGFGVDQTSFARFSAALKDATRIVDLSYLAMAKRAVEFQAAAIGAFAAFGASVVGLADKVAMADQDYRLLALHMFTSLPVARELKIALDALGQPLENVVWDKELAGRFHQLVKDQQEMTIALGPDFERQMIIIRDFRFEVTRLGVEFKYLTMLVVEDLAKAFGTNIQDALQKLREFNSFLISNLPQIATWFTAKLVPALQDTADVMRGLWEFTKQAVATFTTFVGLITGDKSMQSGTANLDKFASALAAVSGGLAGTSMAFLQLGQNVMLVLEAIGRGVAGDFDGARADLGRMKPILEGFEGLAERRARAVIMGKPIADAAPTISTYQQQIAQNARLMGLDPRLALAVAAVESGGGNVNAIRQFDQAGKVLMPNDPNSHAMGIFQLQPKTAQSLGVDPRDANQNIMGGIAYLTSLMWRFGNEKTVLEHFYGSPDPAKNRAYAERVSQVKSGINIAPGGIVVNLNGTSVTANDVKGAVSDALKDAQHKLRNESQRNLSEFQQPGFSY